MSAQDFWTRRRAAVEAEQVAETKALVEAEAQFRQEALEELSDEELLEQFDLPRPESLVAGDDFRVFLQEQVPNRLRQRALRHLWRVNPVLANVDGLVDYGEDFTDASTVVEGLQTAYQVGRGMTQHVEELARQEELAAQPETLVEDRQREETDDVALCDLPQTEADTRVSEPALEDVRTDLPSPQPAAAQHESSQTESTLAEAPPPVPRRMRFRFDEIQKS
ncbi:hypothetical protein RSK20926_13884 [Roseobacter sp. SK209-2-6]|uniref:DUF3306 domain-containing protein n=1 Tax=Roseobacter sp. SK209-2-6 TaxID=388739 RepID=UPI0000F3D664|nr:DUF3306 domain-containing protein [Roseobacter sp. SK209-2-6]EBA15726.1 hypothetical protein RSK20926_13884 [Roseobacter sp. SK209-2-6]